ncbi:BnaCnng39200D [Brassica napus]|uniref:BnaCnng39200D protein n=1 Tax=Brassica napus TaxID=3708 RepID=A0A078JCA4_BRANA|nr:BnaCnng39200D [Brassica napus]
MSGVNLDLRNQQVTLGEKVNTGSYIGIQKLIGRVRTIMTQRLRLRMGMLTWLGKSRRINIEGREVKVSNANDKRREREVMIQNCREEKRCLQLWSAATEENAETERQPTNHDRVRSRSQDNYEGCVRNHSLLCLRERIDLHYLACL